VIRFKLAEQIEKKQFRESRRITIQEVAEASGVNRMTLSKILNHRGYSTGTDIVDKLCTYFGCSVADLLEHIADEG
jgi:putative transcriptional regulator